MTEDEQVKIDRIQRAYNIWKIGEVLRRFVPSTIPRSDKELVLQTYEGWMKSLDEPLIDPNE